MAAWSNCERRESLRGIGIAGWWSAAFVALALIARLAQLGVESTLSPWAAGPIGLIALAVSGCGWWWFRRASDPPAMQFRHGMTSLAPAFVIGIVIAGDSPVVFALVLAGTFAAAAAVVAVSRKTTAATEIAADAALEVPPIPDALAMEEPEPFAFDDPHVTQQLVRSSTDEGLDCLEAMVRVSFAAGEREVAVHVPIQPAMCSIPDVECEPLGEDDVAFKVTAARTFGIRVEVRRRGECGESVVVPIGIAVVARAAQDAAA